MFGKFLPVPECSKAIRVVSLSSEVDPGRFTRKAVNRENSSASCQFCR